MEKNVIVANSAGFCFGVRRAVDFVYDCVKKKEGPIYTYGPIIHNEVVTGELEQAGVRILDPTEAVPSDLPTGIIIIRSHGVTRKRYNEMLASAHRVEDLTCPFVKKIHTTVQEHSENGETIVIIGNKNHPEVIGICGWCENSRYTVIGSEEEALQFHAEPNEKICIVSQTTYNYKKFQELVEIINKKGYDISVINTICNATRDRQAEALSLSKSLDAMIVIGSLASSNTQKLYEICKKECANTYYIQTVDDLDVTKMNKFHSVGITAGASTPNKLIEEVQTNVRNEL
ncbi:MAG: 4-hydroxy-3-methylbut-2-enyl diphosphate reductase [Lachnospiraceae bacterium]|jgi:4-hydroxy-3-methylbut-2-enyl diphosphate reductase|nr:4-hydroxy-3-methylbut-2-enyl diphosphate reductase [Lachnospiraceae bacterium]